MSLEYDIYLTEHIRNVSSGLHWMIDHLDLRSLGISDNDISQAVENAGVHDQSKYDTAEYRAYDDYFYGGNRSYAVQLAFDYAWLHHLHHNPHHWQYWVLMEDDPKNGTSPKVLPMPNAYILEMIADWWTFSWKNGNLEEIFDWYSDHEKKIVMAPKTKKLVDELLRAMWNALQEQKPIEHSGTDDKKYGVPEQKKFPMPDVDHVRSAIRFFNYVSPKYEKELAEAILKRMKEYGLTFDDFTVGDENRFKNYIPEEHLEHSGRLGQKWGERHGPPYPLDQETVQRVYGGTESGSKRSSWADKLDREVEELKDKLKAAKPEEQEELRQKIHDLQEDADARYRMAKFNEPEGPDKDLPDISEKRLKEHPIENLGDLKKLDSDADMKKVRKNINHPDGEDDAGRNYNCPNCAAAFELTERGYDVIARPKPNGSNVENVEDFFKGGKLTNVYPHGIFNPPETDSKRENYRAMSELEKAHDEAAHSALTQMKNQGEGARGIIVVGWMWSDPEDWKYRTTSYHAMNYKVVNEDGDLKVRIFDTQSKRPGNQNGERWYSFLYEADPRDIYIMRTDNLELNDLITTAVYSNKKG